MRRVAGEPMPNDRLKTMETRLFRWPRVASPPASRRSPAAGVRQRPARFGPPSRPDDFLPWPQIPFRSTSDERHEFHKRYFRLDADWKLLIQILGLFVAHQDEKAV